MIRNNIKKFIASTTFLGLGLFLLSGCLQEDKPTKIVFTPTYASQPISCQISFPSLDKESSNKKRPDIKKPQQWQYQQLQFFIHNIEIKTERGDWFPWLMTTNAYQSNNIALLGDVCSKTNNQTNWALELLPLTKTEKITELRFTLGVPFALNHLNPLTQASPLNMPSMFWGWRGGHKFMRIELANKNDDWLFHLGSTGCKALSPVRAPKGECLYPNRINVSLPFSNKTKAIEFDLAVLFNDLLLTRKNSCQSSPDEESCGVLFKNLGLGKIKNNNELLFKAKKHD